MSVIDRPTSADLRGQLLEAGDHLVGLAAKTAVARGDLLAERGRHERAIVAEAELGEPLQHQIRAVLRHQRAVTLGGDPFLVFLLDDRE